MNIQSVLTFIAFMSVLGLAYWLYLGGLGILQGFLR